MNKKDFISVVITTYNRKNIIGRAIDSVLAQTRSADEIILVDDGSSDNTNEFVKNKYPKIKYIWQECRGISTQYRHISGNRYLDCISRFRR
jgi:glycosyltransferase involved in cell wall biosynthesis